MKNRLLCNLILCVCVLTACAGKDAAIPVQTQTVNTLAPTVIPSETPMPAATSSMTATLTPTLTLPPENFALADSGFDIADVRVANVQADTVRIDFKYQVDRNYVFKPSQKLFVMLLIPSACKDEHTNDPRYYIEDSLGMGWFAYKQSSTSRCSLPFFDMTVNVIDKDDDTNVHFQELYRERIKQPLEVAGNSLVIDSRNLTIKNVEFHTTGPWSGQLTFEYAFHSDIQLDSERYFFSLSAAAVVRPCSIWVPGPAIDSPEGKYIININSSSARDPICLSNRDRFSYEGARIFLQDSFTNAELYYHDIGLTITLRKAP